MDDALHSKEDFPGDARRDFHSFLAEYGLTPEWFESVCTRSDDIATYPSDTAPSIVVDDSPIAGRGVFVTSDFTPGEIVAVATWGKHRTLAGRFVNHSHEPNVIPVFLENGCGAYKAIGYIKNGEEITVDYREVMILSYGKGEVVRHG